MQWIKQMCSRSCRDHGDVLMDEFSYKLGHCPVCKMNKPEKQIWDFFTSKLITIYTQVATWELKSQRNAPLKFDFAVIKDSDIFCLIEYDGPRHFDPSSQEQIFSDQKKFEFCVKNNIKLYRISYDLELARVLDNIYSEYKDGWIDPISMNAETWRSIVADEMLEDKDLLPYYEEHISYIQSIGYSRSDAERISLISMDSKIFTHYLVKTMRSRFLNKQPQFWNEMYSSLIKRFSFRDRNDRNDELIPFCLEYPCHIIIREAFDLKPITTYSRLKVGSLKYTRRQVSDISEEDVIDVLDGLLDINLSEIEEMKKEASYLEDYL